MTELLVSPPPADAIAAMVAVPGTQISPSILATQRGPDGARGPESAGAILVLQGTFVDPAGAAAYQAVITDTPSGACGAVSCGVSQGTCADNALALASSSNPAISNDRRARIMIALG